MDVLAEHVPKNAVPLALDFAGQAHLGGRSLCNFWAQPSPPVVSVRARRLA